MEEVQIEEGGNGREGGESERKKDSTNLLSFPFPLKQREGLLRHSLHRGEGITTVDHQNEEDGEMSVCMTTRRDVTKIEDRRTACFAAFPADGRFDGSIWRRDRMKDLAVKCEEAQRSVVSRQAGGDEREEHESQRNDDDSHAELDFSHNTGSNWISPRRVSSIRAFGSVEL